MSATDSTEIDFTVTNQDITGNIIADSIKDTHIDWGTGAGQVSGGDVPLDVTNFDNNLGAGDSDVQTAMETLDELAVGGGGQTVYDAIVDPTGGGDYTTVGAAIAAGKVAILVIGNTTETGNIALPNFSVIEGKNSGVTIGMAAYSFASGTAWQYGLFRNITITSTLSSGSVWTQAMYYARFDGVRLSNVAATGVFDWFANNQMYCKFDRVHVLGSFGRFWNYTSAVSLSNIYNNCYINAGDLGTSGYAFIVQSNPNAAQPGLQFNACSFSSSGYLFDLQSSAAAAAGLPRNTVTFNSCYLAYSGTFLFRVGSGRIDCNDCNVYNGTGSDGIVSQNNSHAYTIVRFNDSTLLGPEYIVENDVATNYEVSFDNCHIPGVLGYKRGTTAVTYEPLISFRNCTSDMNAAGTDSTQYLIKDREILWYKNKSGGALSMGQVVVGYHDATDQLAITTTTSRYADDIVGMVARAGNSNVVVPVVVKGYVKTLKANGTDDIAIGDFLNTYTSAGIAAKAVSGRNAFAIALEAFTTNADSGVLDAYITGQNQILNGSLVVGSGAASTDYTITVDGETNDGVITWMEDEDYWRFDDKVLLTDKISFTQTDENEYIDSLADGYLDLAATTGIRLTSASTRVTGDLYVGNNADVDAAIVFDGDTNDGQVTYHEDEDYFELSSPLMVPVLAGAPATLVNGMLWMEADGLHIYYGGAEKTVAGA